jgi:hypothetical protein
MALVHVLKKTSMLDYEGNRTNSLASHRKNYLFRFFYKRLKTRIKEYQSENYYEIGIGKARKGNTIIVISRCKNPLVGRTVLLVFCPSKRFFNRVNLEKKYLYLYLYNNLRPPLGRVAGGVRAPAMLGKGNGRKYGPDIR